MMMKRLIEDCGFRILKSKNSKIIFFTNKILTTNYQQMTYKINITPETKVGELLDNYPELEDKLIEITPAFKKLKNPVLRKTIAKVTSLKQAAIVGNVQLSHLINELRKESGMKEIVVDVAPAKNKNEKEAVIPDNIKTTYNATEDINSGGHPLPKVMSETNRLKDNEVFLLITPFVPAPLIEKVKEKGFNVVTKSGKDNKIETYIFR